MSAVVVVAFAGAAAGFVNVLAGGGSFLTLPALIAAGLTALGANASSTVALFPAQAITAVLARKDLADPLAVNLPVNVRLLCAISVMGGFAGGLLLLFTPPGAFAAIIPWLVLFATGVFAGGTAFSRGAATLKLGSRGVYIVQGIVSIYGGYFGGGVGILMLAALAIFGLTDLKTMTSLKILLAMLMNVAAVATFVVAGLVRWPQTLVLGTAAVIGSLVGLYAARRVPAGFIRVFVIATGLILAAAFFFKLGV